MAAMFGSRDLLEEILGAMREEGVVMDSHIYPALLKQAALHEGFPKAEALFASLEQTQGPVALGGAAYQTMVAMAFHKGQFLAAPKYLKRMASQGFTDDTYNLYHLAHRLLPKNKKLANQIFQVRLTRRKTQTKPIVKSNKSIN